jgi:hypothetical protein
VHDVFKSSSMTRASLPVLLDIGDDDPDYPLTVQEEVSPHLTTVCNISYFFKIFVSKNI